MSGSACVGRGCLRLSVAGVRVSGTLGLRVVPLCMIDGRTGSL
jgi:hypothetical protein